MTTDYFDWTDARVEQLTAAWTSGSSAKAVATLMGGGLTHSAVICKVNRLGLKRGDEDEIRRIRTEVRAPVREARAAARSARKRAVRRTSTGKVSAIPVPTVVPAEPMLGGVAISDLAAQHCRWPVDIPGEPLRYCGARRPEGSRAYCAAHARLAYSAQGVKAGIDRQPAAPRAPAPRTPGFAGAGAR